MADTPTTTRTPQESFYHVLQGAGTTADVENAQPYAAAVKAEYIRQFGSEMGTNLFSQFGWERASTAAGEKAIADKLSNYSDSIDPFKPRTPEEQAAYDEAIGIINPDDLTLFGYDENGNPEKKRTVTENELVAGVDLGPSAWEGDASAYEGLAFDKLSGDQMKKAGDYFDRLMTGGEDAAAEAEWRGRMRSALQDARSQREADLASLETRGFGGGGGNELLASLVAGQGIAETGAQASLDAAAMQQKRRDDAAISMADIYDRYGNNVLSADSDRAAGLDNFTTNQNNGLDWFGAEQGNLDFKTQEYNAGVYGGVEDGNWDRYWSNNDANANLGNDVVVANAGARQTGTANYGSSLGAEGQYALGSGKLNLDRDKFEYSRDENEEEEDDPLGKVERVAGVTSNVVSLSGSRGKK